MTQYTNIIEDMQSTKFQLYIASAGGGHTVANHILNLSGASSLLIGSTVPYNKNMMYGFLGQNIDKFVSADAAIKMSTQSYNVALLSQHPRDAIIGVGITASLATTNERIGRLHKACIGLHNYYFSMVVYVEFVMGLSRTEEESTLCDIVFNILDTVVNQQKLSLDINHNNIESVGYDLSIRGNHPGISDIPPAVSTVVLFPGSWNPVHDGHKEIATLSEAILGEPVIFELAVNNADKGMISWIDTDIRLDPIKELGYSVVVSDDATFLNKAISLYREDREVIFVCGSDTWIRICDPKYAGELDQLYHSFKQLNVRFLVFGRVDHEYETNHMMNKLLIHDNRARMFNNPITSTKLREESKDDDNKDN